MTAPQDNPREAATPAPLAQGAAPPAWHAPTTAPPAPTSPPPARQPRRGPGWLGTISLVTAGMLLSSGLTLGGVIAYDQLLPESAEPSASASADPAAPGPVVQPASQQGSDWADVAQQVSTSAVAILVAGPDGTSQGTGVVLDDNGHVLTNEHVVSGGTDVTITTNQGRSYPARIVGTDPSTDLAVIQVEDPPAELTPATFADSSTVVVGQEVMALGTPLGLSNTVTTGIISAVNRPVSARGEKGDGSDTAYTSALQTDAAINPGNSGGPLVDAAGQVIGINTAIAAIPDQSGHSGSIGLGFAIPSNTALMIGEQLVEDGTARHAFLGVTSSDGSGESEGVGYRGAEVAAVEPDSPAAEAGVQEGDLLISMDGIPVDGAGALTGLVRGMPIGSTHELQLVRDGSLVTLEVTLAERPT